VETWYEVRSKSAGHQSYLIARYPTWDEALARAKKEQPRQAEGVWILVRVG